LERKWGGGGSQKSQAKVQRTREKPGPRRLGKKKKEKSRKGRTRKEEGKNPGVQAKRKKNCAQLRIRFESCCRHECFVERGEKRSKIRKGKSGPQCEAKGKRGSPLQSLFVRGVRVEEGGPERKVVAARDWLLKHCKSEKDVGRGVDHANCHALKRR